MLKNTQLLFLICPLSLISLSTSLLKPICSRGSSRVLIAHPLFTQARGMKFMKSEFPGASEGYRPTFRTLLDVTWVDLNIRPQELRPNATLGIGQCFNWKRLEAMEDYWVGSLGKLPIVIRQLPHTTEVAFIGEAALLSSTDLKKELYRYFQLEYSLETLYAHWSGGCSRMSEVCRQLQGVRVVRQHPWECLISFICSSNNNIARITQMLDKLKYHYGSYQCSLVFDATNADSNVDTSSLLGRWKIVHAPEHADGLINTAASVLHSSPVQGQGYSMSPTHVVNGRAVHQRPILSPPPSAAFGVANNATTPGNNPGTSPAATNSVRSRKRSLQQAAHPGVNTGRANEQKQASLGLTLKTEDSPHGDDPVFGDSPDHHQHDQLQEAQQPLAYHFYEFPTVSALAAAREEDLRLLGMGYRAKFILGAAKLLQQKTLAQKMAGSAATAEPAVSSDCDESGDSGEEWLYNLRSLAAHSADSTSPPDVVGGSVNSEHSVVANGAGEVILNPPKKQQSQRNCKRKLDLESGRSGSSSSSSSSSSSNDRNGVIDSRLAVQTALLDIPGVGRKVADCVALFSLDQRAAIPVDTHVWSIATRDYLQHAPHLREAKSLTPTVYEQVCGYLPFCLVVVNRTLKRLHVYLYDRLVHRRADISCFHFGSDFYCCCPMAYTTCSTCGIGGELYCCYWLLLVILMCGLS